MSDIISRKLAIELLENTIAMTKKEERRRNYCVELIKAMPSVEPVRKWIPCSERLPDRIGRYLVYSTTIPVWKHHILNYDPEYDQWFWDGLRSEECDIKVLAWMPLPEPYEGDKK